MSQALSVNTERLQIMTAISRAGVEMPCLKRLTRVLQSKLHCCEISNRFPARKSVQKCVGM